MLSKIPSLNMRWGLKFAEAVTLNSPVHCTAIQACGTKPSLTGTLNIKYAYMTTKSIIPLPK